MCECALATDSSFFSQLLKNYQEREGENVYSIVESSTGAYMEAYPLVRKDGWLLLLEFFGNKWPETEAQIFLWTSVQK